MNNGELLPMYDQYLEEYVYEKIWSELSEKDRFVTEKLATQETMKIQDLREMLGMFPGEMSIYRNRLIKKGVVTSPKYGYLSLALPRFGAIIQNWI